MSYGSIKYPFIFLELEFPLILNSSAICAMFILLIELDVAEFLVYVDSCFTKPKVFDCLQITRKPNGYYFILGVH